jgi:hypothetical protein
LIRLSFAIGNREKRCEREHEKSNIRRGDLLSCAVSR